MAEIKLLSGVAGKGCVCGGESLMWKKVLNQGHIKGEQGLHLHLPVDGSPRHEQAKHRGHEGVVKLNEQPARFFNAVIEEDLRSLVKVTLDKDRLEGFTQLLCIAHVPLWEERERKRNGLSHFKHCQSEN